MRQRLFRIILPVIAIAMAISVIVSLVLLGLRQEYQQNTNREVAALLGVTVAGGDTADLIENLRNPSIEHISAGTAILQQYGYLPGDYASLGATQFFTKALFAVLIAFVVFMIMVIVYFCWRDQQRHQQITKLIGYMQHLSERVYDLQLEENSEDELSILSNELYKIMVLLREAADNNQKARQHLETALADISHQLRTPLTSMQIMVDNIYDDPKMPIAIRQDFLRSISRQVEAMSNLVMTLLNLAKFDNGSIRLQKLPVEAGELLTEVRQKLEVLADLREVTIVLAGDLQAKARLDRRWQVEALANIVKDCLEHSPPNSEVRITVNDSPLFLRLKIEDEGEGIAAKDLHHIFERFYKAKNASANSIGIGLAFAKTVIEADNGQISVRSQEGEGTEFIVTYYK